MSLTGFDLRSSDVLGKTKSRETEHKMTRHLQTFHLKKRSSIPTPTLSHVYAYEVDDTSYAHTRILNYRWFLVACLSARGFRNAPVAGEYWIEDLCIRAYGSMDEAVRCLVSHRDRQDVDINSFENGSRLEAKAKWNAAIWEPFCSISKEDLFVLVLFLVLNSGRGFACARNGNNSFERLVLFWWFGRFGGVDNSISPNAWSLCLCSKSPEPHEFQPWI